MDDKSSSFTQLCIQHVSQQVIATSLVGSDIVLVGKFPCPKLCMMGNLYFNIMMNACSIGSTYLDPLSLSLSKRKKKNQYKNYHEQMLMEVFPYYFIKRVHRIHQSAKQDTITPFLYYVFWEVGIARDTPDPPGKSFHCESWALPAN